MARLTRVSRASDDPLSIRGEQRQISSTGLRHDGKVAPDDRQALKKKIEPAGGLSPADLPEESSPTGSAAPLQQGSAARRPFPSAPPPPAKGEKASARAKTEPERARLAAPPPAVAPVRAEAAPPEPKQDASVIGAGAELRGTLALFGRLVVNGGFSGKIDAREGTVRIGREGKVQGEIEATDLQVEGRVRGGLSARNAVELRKGADVQGSIRCLCLRIDAEAAFLGPCECYPAARKQEPAIVRPDLYGFFTAARVVSLRL